MQWMIIAQWQAAFCSIRRHQCDPRHTLSTAAAAAATTVAKKHAPVSGRFTNHAVSFHQGRMLSLVYPKWCDDEIYKQKQKDNK